MLGIKELEEYFNSITIPDSLRLNDQVNISDLKKCIDTNLTCLKANSGKAGYKPYYDQLIDIKNKSKKTLEFLITLPKADKATSTKPLCAPGGVEQTKDPVDEIDAVDGMLPNMHLCSSIDSGKLLLKFMNTVVEPPTGPYEGTTLTILIASKTVKVSG